jgi:hypothetical protein
MRAMGWLAVALLGAGTTLAGCEVAEDEDALLGPDRSFREAIQIAETQWREVADIEAIEGPTRWVELPVSGSGMYRGVVAGRANGGVPIDYVADLALEVDFDRRDASGSVRNMVTNGVGGFEHPDGEIGLSGVVARDGDGGARIVVDGSGLLRGPGMEAEVAIDGAGSFVGDRAEAVRGQQVTDFVWTRGYLQGTTSHSDGVFTAVATE